MRYLGIDYGLKCTGLAVGDDESNIAGPLRTVDTVSVVKEIERAIREEGIDELVIGMPAHADGSDSEQLRLTKKFVQAIEHLGRVNTIDERFTTGSARELMDAGMDGDKDSLAATVILQAFLDEKRTQ